MDCFSSFEPPHVGCYENYWGDSASHHSDTPALRQPPIPIRLSKNNSVRPVHYGKVPGGKFIVFRDRLQIPSPHPGLPKAVLIKHFSGVQSRTCMHIFILRLPKPVFDRIHSNYADFCLAFPASVLL